MIRPLNDKSEDYRILENAINEDGQRSPIMIRFLSEEEKQNAHAGAIYGIIDGHHRYHIAQKFNRENIMSKVDDTPSDPVRDAMLAFYRCVQKYKDSIGEPIIKKPRKNKQEYDPNVLKENLTKLFDGRNGSYAIHNDFAFDNSRRLEEKLNLIKDVKTQIRLLEKHLSEILQSKN